MPASNHTPRVAESSFHVLGGTRSRSNDVDSLQTKDYRRRQPHQKSKNGCLMCKTKRVKCDEARPCCRRCSRHKTCCVYETRRQRDSPVQYDDTHVVLTSDSLLFNYPAVARPASLQNKIALTPVAGADTRRLLSYFNDVRKNLILPGPIDTETILPLALEKPHLLHAILAVSVSHLRRHTPNVPFSWQMEHSQQALSAQKLQVALQEPLDQAASDALLLSSMLLNLLAFIVPEDDSVSYSWVFGHGSNGLGWFRLQLGLRALLYTTRHFHGQRSTLRKMFEASNEEGRFPDHHNVPDHWFYLCSMENTSEPPSTTYKDCLYYLASLRDLEPRPENFMLHLKAFGNFDMDFYHALVRREPAALWILGYWLGLLCRYDTWWIKGMAMRDYAAIAQRLQLQGLASVSGNTGAIWKQLLKDLESSLGGMTVNTQSQLAV